MQDLLYITECKSKMPDQRNAGFNLQSWMQTRKNLVCQGSFSAKPGWCFSTIDLTLTSANACALGSPRMAISEVFCSDPVSSRIISNNMSFSSAFSLNGTITSALQFWQTMAKRVVEPRMFPVVSHTPSHSLNRSVVVGAKFKAVWAVNAPNKEDKWK